LSEFLIKFAFQHWNNQFNWWHPNTIPLDFIVDGQRRPPATHDYHWFDHDVRSVTARFDLVDLFNFPAQQSEYLCNYKNVRYYNLEEVKDTKYIFPITVHAVDYFVNHEHVGFNFISDQVLNDVKNGKAKIVLMFPLEGNCGEKNSLFERDFEILNAWCLKSNLTQEHVYFIHGNFKIDATLKNYNFTYVPVHAFHCWLATEMDDILDYTPTDNKNLFLTYNRRCDHHRLLLISYLIKNNMLDRGLVSFSGKAYYVRTSMTELVGTIPELSGYQIGQQLDQILPLELDVPLEFNNPVTEIVKEHHAATFLNIVTETRFRPGTTFYSEKTWKPILAGQPFMFVGTQGLLAELKKQGYQSFDRWFSEEYDNEPDISTRIQLVVAELIKLSKLSAQQLIEMRKEMAPVLRHNQLLFLNQRNTIYKNRREEYLYVEIKKIWNSF
jgi:hypothetical protein